MKIAVSIYFWGEKLDPAAVTAALNVRPTQAHAKNETRASSTDKQVTAKIGMWGYSTDSEIDSAELGEHILFLQSKFSDSLNKITELKNIQDSCIDIFVATELNKDGADYEFELTPNNIVALSNFGLPVRFTIARVED